MAASDREATFTIRAADLSSQPIKDIVAQLERLIKSQNDLNTSAKNGTVSNADFQKSLQSLQAGFKALVDQRASINELLRLQGALETRTNSLAAAQEKYVAKLIEFSNLNPEGFTTKQTNELARLERGIGTATRQLGNAERAFAGISQVTKQFGVDTSNAAEANVLLGQTLDRLAPALKAARVEELSLVENRRAAAKAADEAAAATKREQAADEDFAARNRALNAQRKADGEAIIAQEQRDAAARANARKFDFEQAVAAQSKEDQLRASAAEADARRAQVAKQLADSQSKIIQAREAVAATVAPGQVGAGTSDFPSASQAVLATINPSAAARQTLAGLNAELDKLAASYRNVKKRTEDYSADLRQLMVIATELQRQSGLADTFRRQQAEVTSLGTELKRLDAEYQANLELQRRAGVVDAEVERRLQGQVTAIRNLTNAYNSANARFSETGKALRQTGIDTGNLEKEFSNLTNTATKVKAAIDRATEGAEGRGGQGGISLFGLRPYELQNLSYQINDIFTQLSSGTSLRQTLSQQGGQIFQLFQRDLAAFYGSIKEVPFALAGIGTAAVAATAALVLLVKELDRASERKNFAAAVLLGDQSGDNTAKSLEDSAKAAARLGASYADAAKGARDLAQSGFTQAQVTPILTLAQNLSKASGGTITLAEAVKQITGLANGGKDALDKFSANVVRIDADVLQYAKDQLEAGNQANAFAAVFDNISGRIEQASRKQTTGFTLALRAINDAFDRVLDVFERVEKKLASSAILNFLSRATAFGAVLNTLPLIRGQEVTSGQNVPAGGVAVPNNFNEQRDRAADIAGVRRDALEALQRSEAQPVNGVFPNGLTKSGEVAGIGPLQVTRSTFAELQKEFPELLKGPITDVQTNLIAGALYFRKQLETAGGDVALAARAYKQGPKVFTDRNFDAGHPEYATSANRVGGSVSGDGRTTPRPDLGPIASEGGGVTANPDTAKLFQTARNTEGVTAATNAFVEDLRKKSLSIGQLSLSGQAALDRQKELLDEEDKALREDAQRQAERNNLTALDRDRQEEAIKTRRIAREQEIADARLRIARENFKAVDAVQAELDRRDATDLDRIQQANEQKFNALRDRAREAGQGLGGQSQADVNLQISRLDAAQPQALAQDYVKAASAITDAVVKQRDDQIAAIRALRLGVDEETRRINATVTEYIPKITEAARKSNEAVDRANTLLGRSRDTPEQAAIRERNAATIAQANRPDTAVAAEQAQRQQQQSDFDSSASIRDNTIASIRERLKRQEINLTQATNEYAAQLPALNEKVRAAYEKSTAGLLTIRNSPLTTDTQKSEIDAIIQRNKSRLEATQEGIQSIIDAGLKDANDQLAADIKNRDTITADILKRFSEGLISVTTASQQLKENSDKFAGKIKSDAAQVAQNLTGALSLPGLSAGQRADLSDQLTRARGAENTDRPNNDAQIKLVNDQIAKITAARQSVSETQSLNQTLLSKGIINVEQAEASNKRAFDEANKSIEGQSDAVLKLIQNLDGLSPAQVEALTGKVKLLNAELKYVDPLTQQISSGFESSFASRGETAIESVAKSLGDALVNGGKLSDVFKDAGVAFGQFTAGVLQDVAKIILRYQLLALVKRLAGGSGGGGGGDFTSDGSGAGFAPEDSTGIDEASADANGLGGGGDGGAGAASSAVGIVGTIAKLAASILHDGGEVTSAATRHRPISFSVFQNAPRFHDGADVGLAPDEVPAILQKGERVLSKAQVRDQAQAGGGGSSPQAVRNVLAVGDDEIAKALNGSHGEQVIINTLRRNAPTVRKLLG